MKFLTKTKSATVTLLALVVLIATISLVYLLVFHDRSDYARRQLLRAAESYQSSDTDCAPVETAAIHLKSGVEYTFQSDCLPDGWGVIASDRTQSATTSSDAPVSDGQKH